MPLLTMPEIRALVQTDLKDAALKHIADAELKRIERSVGKNKAVTETHNSTGLRDTYTKRPILSITSIKERRTLDSAQVTLSTNDYRVLGDRLIRRLPSGDNGADWWGSQAEIIYDPVDDIDERNGAHVELIRIAIDVSLVESEKSGDYSAKYKNVAAERKHILDGLSRQLPIA